MALRVRPRLEDAQAMHRKSPTTFKVPTDKELKRVVPGTYVQVCAATERFWCLIKVVDGINLLGVVDNELNLTSKHGLSKGTEILLRKQHIYDVRRKKRERVETVH